MKTSDIILISAIAVLVVALTITCDRLESKQVEASSYVALNSELKVSVDKKGREVAERQAVIVQSEKDLLRMSSKNDSAFMELQSMVKKLKGRAIGGAIIGNTTEYDKTVPTVRDTVEAIVIYTGAYKDEWIEWSGYADQDSFRVHSIVDNKYEYSVSNVNPLFKKAYSSAKVVNLNPYTRTDEFVSFQVDVPEPRLIMGLGVQYGLDMTDFRTARLTVGPNITYRLVKVK